MDDAPSTTGLALPWLQVTFPDLAGDVWPRIVSAASKFAAGGSARPLALTAHVSVDGQAPRAWPTAPNARFQFVDGVEGDARAMYATADGSTATVDHAQQWLTLHINRSVFDAPYSTWADLLAAPLSAHWRAHGYFPLHAAAVSVGRVAALVVGPSGAGKTTMALALCEVGARWRADDKLLLDTHTGEVRAVSLYRNTNLAPATIARHESLRFALDKPPINDTNDKRPCLLDEVSTAVDLGPFRPTALLFPSQTPTRRSQLRRLSQVDALVRLAEQSPMYGWPPRVRSQQRVLAALAAQAPAWEVEAGTDVLDDRAAFALEVFAAIGMSAVSVV